MLLEETAGEMSVDLARQSVAELHRSRFERGDVGAILLARAHGLPVPSDEAAQRDVVRRKELPDLLDGGVEEGPVLGDGLVRLLLLLELGQEVAALLEDCLGVEDHLVVVVEVVRPLRILQDTMAQFQHLIKDIQLGKTKD